MVTAGRCLGRSVTNSPDLEFRLPTGCGAAVGSVNKITLTMPNRHCLLVNLEPFGQDNPNESFMPINEPHGTIEARIIR